MKDGPCCPDIHKPCIGTTDVCDENRLDRADNVGICNLEANAIETDVLDRPFLWKIFFEIREDSWVSAASPKLLF
jgi:hypothetical protein